MVAKIKYFKGFKWKVEMYNLILRAERGKFRLKIL